MKVLATIVVMLVMATFSAIPQASATAHHRHRHPCGTNAHQVQPWLCAKRLSKSWYGWTGAEWVAESKLVSHESGWDYCVHYPSTHDCAYTGTNACGIPQRDPCPTEWTKYGLDKWHRQVFWMLHYIHDRWGDPETAYWHEQHDTY